jgi:hypothetical protein
MQLNDTVVLDGKPRRTADGYLTAVAKVARTGIQHYLGSEVGRPDMSVVRVYRPPASVFDDAAMKSFAHRPMTNDHPSKFVDASNWRTVSVGHTGDEVVQDGKSIRVPLVMMDAQAISDVESGKRQLSAGYSCEIEFMDGVTEDGEQYDAVQTQIRCNHIALVGRARGGSDLKIGDDGKPIIPTRTVPMSDTNTRTVMVDGIPVITTDAGATVIDALQRRLSDAASAAATATAANATAIAAKDTEIGGLKAELQKAKDAAVTPAQLDALVKDRSTLVGLAAALVPTLKCDGLSDADIRKAVVDAKMPDFTKDASPDQIKGAFAVLAKDAKPTDPFRRVAQDGLTGGPNHLNDNGYAASVAELNAGSQFGKTAGARA